MAEEKASSGQLALQTEKGSAGALVEHVGRSIRESGSGQALTKRKSGSRGRAEGSTHEVISGVRRVKGYPLSRDELFGLGGAGVLATTTFSLGGTCLGRAFDIGKDLAMVQEIPKEVRVRWETKADDYWNAGLIFMAIGAVALVAGGLKVISIIRSTKHPDEFSIP